jgi:hypothetical protein
MDNIFGILDIFKHMDELTEKKKDEERKKNVLIYLLER